MIRTYVSANGTTIVVDLNKEYPEFPYVHGYFTIKLDFCKIINFTLPIIEPKDYFIKSYDSH
jgi:hypothetical protein